MHASRYQIVVSGRLGVALDLIGLTGLAPGPDIRRAQ
jgi:hypothetical protein